MITKNIPDFDIQQICDSGQCFRMSLLEKDKWIDTLPTYSVIALDRYLKVAQRDETVFFDCSVEDYENFWKIYFDLETDYSQIKNSIDPDDDYLNRAVISGAGIRILRQDLWEMIVSFLISQQNNIPRIRKCIDNICREYGRRCINEDGEEFYSFPSATQLALLPEDELMKCNLGYRSKYVVRTATAVAAGEYNLEEIKLMDYETACEVLLSMYGVGRKVADCILLFSLHHVDAFPIDTHIKQVLSREYADGFPFDRYSGYAGIIQQYIFYYELLMSQMSKNKMQV